MMLSRQYLLTHQSQEHIETVPTPMDKRRRSIESRLSLTLTLHARTLSTPSPSSSLCRISLHTYPLRPTRRCQPYYTHTRMRSPGDSATQRGRSPLRPRTRTPAASRAALPSSGPRAAPPLAPRMRCAREWHSDSMSGSSPTAALLSYHHCSLYRAGLAPSSACILYSRPIGPIGSGFIAASVDGGVFRSTDDTSTIALHLI